MPSIALLSVLKDQRSVSHAHITVILNPIFASPAAAIFIFRTFIFPRHAPLLACNKYEYYYQTTTIIVLQEDSESYFVSWLVGQSRTKSCFISI